MRLSGSLMATVAVAVLLAALSFLMVATGESARSPRRAGRSPP